MFKRLPPEIIRYIYEYDDTYKQYFSKYILYLLDNQKFYPLHVLPQGSYYFERNIRKFIIVKPTLK